MPATAQPYVRLMLLLLAMGAFGGIWSGDRQGVCHFPIARREALKRATETAKSQTPALPAVAHHREIALACFPNRQRTRLTYQMVPDGERWQTIVIAERMLPLIEGAPKTVSDLARIAVRGAETVDAAVTR